MQRKTKFIAAGLILGHMLLWSALGRAEPPARWNPDPSIETQARIRLRELRRDNERAAAQRTRPAYFAGSPIERQTALAFCSAVPGGGGWRAAYCASAAAGR